MTETSFDRIAVLGDGGWGTALALVLSESGAQVILWSAFPDYAEDMKRERANPKFLPGVSIPERIAITARFEDLEDSSLVLSVIPSKFLRSVLDRYKDHHEPGKPVVSATKGLEDGTLATGTSIIRDILGDVPLAVLSGPSHAEEVALRMPTTVVLASEDTDLARRIQDRLTTDRFRVYTHDDVIGVEMGGVLKNVISIAAGIVDGLGFGANTKSALLSRGIVEIGRLGEAMGAQRNSFFGLSGIGDLMTSCFSPYGRNRAVGEKLGKGLKIDEILS
ncbi:MAG: NAD(P)H-dependent glycerol-3-phosphate dehydrogenase, partial [Planctomycetota bacterium]